MLSGIQKDFVSPFEALKRKRDSERCLTILIVRDYYKLNKRNKKWRSNSERQQ